MSLKVTVKTSDLRKLSKDLRKHADGKRLAKELRQELRAVVKPFVPIVRSAIAAIPSKNQNAALGRGSLRKQMQRATKVKVRPTGKAAGVSLGVIPSMIPGYHRQNLPAYMEKRRGYTRWRHPNWGRKDRSQQPGHPYFYKSVLPAGERAFKATQNIVDRIAKEIEK